MLAIIKTVNGVKKIIKVTADVGAGNPVGSYLYLEKKSNPQGYLYCDGSTFDETQYPLLYAYLGSNVLPDWRELGAKGAEKNTTLIFDSTETDPSTGQAGTQNHDVFAQGEFKDDQLQDHKHSTKMAGGTAGAIGRCVSSTTPYNQDSTNEVVLNVINARTGTVTRGKSRAVFIYIKATSGLSENAQDNVLAQFKEYSKNQNLLSDYETFSLTDTNKQVQYDGFLLVRTKGSSTWGCSIFVNDTEVSTSYAQATATITTTIPVIKGDNVRYSGNAPDGTKARFYKLRDYTGR